MRNSSTPPLLRLEDICVKFGFVEALKSVNLSIQRQEVVAIVGDNGAGKSTLIKVIAGFLQPGFGHIYLNGEQVTIPSIREADRMGIASVFQGQEFCDNLDVASNLFLGKEINQIGIRDDDSMNSRARSVLKTLSSAIRVGSPIASLSVGQRQTVAIARTLLNDPQLILLDEPTVAVDPQSRNKILQGILKLNEEGATIIYTSHYMEEVEQICSRIVIMDKGRNLANGTATELKQLIKKSETLTVEILELTDTQLEAVRRLNHVYDVSYENNRLTVQCSGGSHNLIHLLSYLQEENIAFGRVYSELPTLNDVFLEITGSELRD